MAAIAGELKPAPGVGNWRTPLVVMVCGCAIALLTFGPRSCLGAPFAMLEIRTVLAMIVQRYRLDLVPQLRQRSPPRVLSHSPQWASDLRRLDGKPRDRVEPASRGARVRIRSLRERSRQRSRQRAGQRRRDSAI